MILFMGVFFCPLCHRLLRPPHYLRCLLFAVVIVEEMEDTGEKVLYLCLEKVADMEALAANSMPQDWVGVLEGEEPLNVYYPDKDKVCVF